MTEEWRAVEGYGGDYEVSSLGRVRRLPRISLQGRPLGLKYLSLQDHPKGYKMVALRQAGKSKMFLVHRLVCEAFHGPAPEGKTDACHNNEVKDDNRAINLRWGSRSENIQQYADSGRYRNQNTDLTHCANGHEFTPENTRVWVSAKRGTRHRICRQCASINTRRHRERQRDARFDLS